MTEANVYIDRETVAPSKPLGLWFLQAYFLVRTSVFVFTACNLFVHANVVPRAASLLPAAIAGAYLIGIAAAQGTWRYSRSVCVALMLVTIALELLSHIGPTTSEPADLEFGLENEGQRVGSQLVQLFGPVIQSTLLLYLLFSRHVRKFLGRRQPSAVQPTS